MAEEPGRRSPRHTWELLRLRGDTGRVTTSSVLYLYTRGSPVLCLPQGEAAASCVLPRLCRVPRPGHQGHPAPLRAPASGTHTREGWGALEGSGSCCWEVLGLSGTCQGLGRS